MSWQIENQTHLPTGMIRSALREAKDRLDYEGHVEVVVREVSHAEVAAGLRENGIASLDEWVRVNGGGSFQSWVNYPRAAVDGKLEAQDPRITVEWVPSLGPGLSSTEGRVNSHGGIIWSTDSLGDALRFSIGHEWFHLKQFENGVTTLTPEHEREADEFALSMVEGR